MKIGKKLVEMRTSRGMKQTDVASALGVTYKSISNWENDEREPSFEMLEKIAVFFGVTIGYIFGDDENSDSKNKDLHQAFIDRIIDDLIEDGTITEEQSFENLDSHDQQILLGALNKHINEILKNKTK